MIGLAAVRVSEGWLFIRFSPKAERKEVPRARRLGIHPTISTRSLALQNFFRFARSVGVCMFQVRPLAREDFDMVCAWLTVLGHILQVRVDL